MQLYDGTEFLRLWVAEFLYKIHSFFMGDCNRLVIVDFFTFEAFHTVMSFSLSLHFQASDFAIVSSIHIQIHYITIPYAFLKL